MKKGDSVEKVLWTDSPEYFGNNHYLLDEMRSPIRLMDGAGGPLGYAVYDEFGQTVSTEGMENQPFTYTSYQRDDIAGTYFAQARQYNPEIGRFEGRDWQKGEIEYPLSLNEYIYCGNMPFLYYDPDGEAWHIAIGAVAGLLVGAAWEAGTQVLVEGRSVRKLKWKRIGAAALGGAVTGGITAATGNIAAGKEAGVAAKAGVHLVKHYGGAALGGFTRGSTEKALEGKYNRIVTGGLEEAGRSVLYRFIGRGFGRLPAIRQSKDIYRSAFRDTKGGSWFLNRMSNYKGQLTRNANLSKLGINYQIGWRSWRNGLMYEAVRNLDLPENILGISLRNVRCIE